MCVGNNNDKVLSCNEGVITNLLEQAWAHIDRDKNTVPTHQGIFWLLTCVCCILVPEIRVHPEMIRVYTSYIIMISLCRLTHSIFWIHYGFMHKQQNCSCAINFVYDHNNMYMHFACCNPTVNGLTCFRFFSSLSMLRSIWELGQWGKCFTWKRCMSLSFENKSSFW